MMLAWAWLGVTEIVVAQEPSGTTPSAPTKPGAIPAAKVGSTVPALDGPSDRPEDRKAIQSVAAAFSRAYNAGDAHSAAALFTEDAEIVDENGGRLRGRPTIEHVFTSMFQARPGATLVVTPASYRFLGPDVALEEGRTRVKSAEGEPDSSRHYMVLFVKQGGRWMYSSVREQREPGIAHPARLNELDWLVGEWLDESRDSVVNASCHWTKDHHFLLREFTIQVRGKSAMTVSERIGWDPLTKQIKSWVFDSEGGYGQGLWSRNRDEWIIKSTGVLPDGRTATATHVLTRLSPQSARWRSVERTVGDRVVPDHAEYTMVRKPSQPRTK